MITIGTKLKLTTEGMEALEHVKQGFEHIDEKIKEVGHEMMGMARQAAAVAIGFQLGNMIESVKEFGGELVEEADHLANQNKELMGLISLTDKSEMSMDELSQRATELGEHLEGLAVSTRVTKTSLVEAFEMIASRSTGTADHIEDMVGKMAVASRALPGGMSTLAAGWRDLEAGIVRPKNALLTLMKQTGVVEGSLKKVAKGMTAMLAAGKQEEVFKLAEAAIDRMSKKMAAAPPTFDQVVASLHDLREMTFETMGMPILRAIVPPLERARMYLVAHREELVRLAETMGKDVGAWVTHAAELVREGFEYLRDHAAEIEEALKMGAAAIKDAIAFMVAHRELLLGLAAAKFVGGPMLGRAGSIAAAVPGIGSAFGKALGQGAPMMGLAGGAGMAAAGVGAAAAVAAVGAWMVANKQASKLEAETGFSMTQILRHLWDGERGLAAASDRMMNFNAVLKRIADDEHGVEATVGEIDHYIAAIERSGRAAVQAGDLTAAEYDRLLAKANAQAEAHAKVADAFDSLNAAAGEAMGLGGLSSAAQAIGNITSAYRQASEQNAAEATNAARRILTANSNLVAALVGGPGTVEMALKKLQSLASGAGGDDVKLPPIQFGPNTINVKQDFRDQDPDRVAIVFRRDLPRQAVQRVGARTGQSFGY